MSRKLLFTEDENWVLVNDKNVYKAHRRTGGCTGCAFISCCSMLPEHKCGSGRGRTNQAYPEIVWKRYRKQDNPFFKVGDVVMNEEVKERCVYPIYRVRRNEYKEFEDEFDFNVNNHISSLRSSLVEAVDCGKFEFLRIAHKKGFDLNFRNGLDFW
jgi:hypothetical protein